MLAKHTKHLSLVDILSVGVDRMQRNFEPMKKQVEAWKGTRLPDDTAKLVIYRAFVEGELDLYRAFVDDGLDARNTWLIAYTSSTLTLHLRNLLRAFKSLDPIPQFKATTRLGPFLELTSTSSN